MRRLELDFQRARRPSLGPQILLAALAVAFAADVAWSHMQTQQRLELLRSRLERAQPVANRAPLVKVAARPVSAEELSLARDTIRRLSTPWDALFKALEASRIESVALLSVEPDPAARTVLIQGEAKDYFAALSYVANLSEQRALGGVHLLRHELRPNEPVRPVQFSVTASWGHER